MAAHKHFPFDRSNLIYFNKQTLLMHPLNNLTTLSLPLIHILNRGYTSLYPTLQLNILALNSNRQTKRLIRLTTNTQMYMQIQRQELELQIRRNQRKIKKLFYLLYPYKNQTET